MFTRTAAGLAFTPGGLRLASRAIEILGLQRQTAIEVTEAGHGRRLLKIAASSAFAEHAAPGLIELFSSRADDLSVELSVHPTGQFRDLISSRAVDIALGPASENADGSITVRPFLKYQTIAVAAPGGPLTAGMVTPAQLREQQWMLGPSAGSVDGEIAAMLRNLAIPESRQRIFQSDAAALEEVQRLGGVTLTIGFAISKDLAAGRVAHGEGARVANFRRVVRVHAVAVRAPTGRLGTGALHHHPALHPGDDPGHRRRRDSFPPQSACHALELEPRSLREQTQTCPFLGLSRHLCVCSRGQCLATGLQRANQAGGVQRTLVPLAVDEERRRRVEVHHLGVLRIVLHAVQRLRRMHPHVLIESFDVGTDRHGVAVHVRPLQIVLVGE